MRSAQAKMLHPLAGIPLVAHVIEAAREARPLSIAMVVGHGGDAVEKALAAPDLVFVRQDPPRGTGDAVRCALAVLPHDGVTVVANGDCPLIPAATFAALAGVAAHGRLALLTARVADPRGLGRVLRTAGGSVRAIVEERDASDAERAIDEIYTGALAAPSALLAAWVTKLTAHNAQGEYYLTDVVAMALADGVPVHAELADDADVARGVNDLETSLARLESAKSGPSRLSTRASGPAAPSRVE